MSTIEKFNIKEDLTEREKDVLIDAISQRIRKLVTYGRQNDLIIHNEPLRKQCRDIDALIEETKKIYDDIVFLKRTANKIKGNYHYHEEELKR